MRPITPVAIARVAYEARRLYSRALGENVQPVWDQASTQQRDDTLSGVQAVLSGTANSAERLHDALTQQPSALGPPYGFFAPGYDDLGIDQRRKLLLFRAIVLALVDGPCNGLCHDEKCSLLNDHNCHLDTCLSRFGIPPGLCQVSPTLDGGGYEESPRAEKLCC